jgi:hypothetical protein
MSVFDIYAFADYSGYRTESDQKKSIALSVIGLNENEQSYTRESLRVKIQSILVKASDENERVIFGFDHSYSFPVGFYDAITGAEWGKWEQLIELLGYGSPELPPINDEPREWAKIANNILCKNLRIDGGGPFWGANFKYQQTKPKFPYEESFKEKRLTEERCPKTKPIYQLGGNGAVGLQSLYGIQHLAKLRHDLKIIGIKLFCWPFEGWELPSNGHVLVEIYPGLFNKKSKGDAEDAKACSEWLYEQDKTNRLVKWFNPKIKDDELKRASLEGWILGVR